MWRIKDEMNKTPADAKEPQILLSTGITPAKRITSARIYTYKQTQEELTYKYVLINIVGNCANCGKRSENP